ncbi:hypothetical protein II906_12035 [bacterium]|nr:hypothetical protein [bacterium]
MKIPSFSIFNIASVIFIALVIVLIIVPFNFINMEQAQRTAKWLDVYEKIQYDFELEKIHEGAIVPELTSSKEYSYILAPYLNLNSGKTEIKKHYKYRYMNGRQLEKSSQFYFDKFTKTKDGIYVGLKESIRNETDSPLYYMFVDINGKEKPNKIGEDIFFISIYQDKIAPFGSTKKHADLKKNCSPLGSGIYCSEYYLRSGSL